VKPGESVELDIAVKVLETVASGAVLATLKDLYSYLKRRRNKVTHRQARYPKTRQHVRIVKVSMEVREIIGYDEDDDDEGRTHRKKRQTETYKL
jgi:hypothetical protein